VSDDKDQRDTPNQQKRAAFIRLRELLTRYWDNKEDLLRLLTDSGIDQTKINFDGSVANVWHRIMMYANKKDKLPELVAQTVKRFSNVRPAFEAALTEYQQAPGEIADDWIELELKPLPKPVPRPSFLKSVLRIGAGVLLVAGVVIAWYCFANRCAGGFNAQFLVLYGGRPIVATTTFNNPCTKQTDAFECTPDRTTEFRMPHPGRYRFLACVGLTNRRPTRVLQETIVDQNTPIFQCSKEFDVDDTGQPISLNFTEADIVPVHRRPD